MLELGAVRCPTGGRIGNGRREVALAIALLLWASITFLPPILAGVKAGEVFDGVDVQMPDSTSLHVEASRLVYAGWWWLAILAVLLAGTIAKLTDMESTGAWFALCAVTGIVWLWTAVALLLPFLSLYHGIGCR